MHFGSENMSIMSKILISYHPFVVCHLTLLLQLGLRTHTCYSGDHFKNHGEIQTLRTLWFNILFPSEHDFIVPNLHVNLTIEQVKSPKEVSGP